jgi:hypothetical protein
MMPIFRNSSSKLFKSSSVGCTFVCVSCFLTSLLIGSLVTVLNCFCLNTSSLLKRFFIICSSSSLASFSCFSISFLKSSLCFLISLSIISSEACRFSSIFFSGKHEFLDWIHPETNCKLLLHDEAR